MQKHFPATPAEALEISPALRFVMSTVCKCADTFGFWSLPAKGAATDFPEMTLLDKIYWVYKSSRPTVLGEKGEYDERYFHENSKVGIGLPAGFEKGSSVTLGAMGDLVKTDGLEKSKDLLYEEVADLVFDQDISFANLESQLTSSEVVKEVLSDRESPIECCSFEQYEAVKGHCGRNFTIMNTACNHTLDMGVEGVETTLRQLERDAIIDLGTHREPSEQGKGKIILKNGIRIGFAAVTFGLNGKEVPKGKEYVVDVARLLPKAGEADLSLIKRQIDWCRLEGCDFIIASLHWGYEFELFPRERQVAIAHELVEYGADAIIGHHPHVVQPVECYRPRRDNSRLAVIAYSLGSLTWSFSAPHLVLSAILNLTLAKGRFQGEEKTYIERVDVVPVYHARRETAGGTAVSIRRLYGGQANGDGRETPEYIAGIKRFAELVFGARLK